MLEKLKAEAVGILGSLLLRVINLTLRWEVVGFEGEERYWVNRKPCIILAFWHGRQLFMPWIYLNHKRGEDHPGLHVLISQHRDGRLIASVMRHLGIDSVAGSSSRGGYSALRSLIRIYKDGNHLAITPDGPKGPKHKLKDGVILLAQRTGAQIHPAAYSAERYWTFRSWDGMIFPKPFSRAVLIKGTPISIPRAAKGDELREISAAVEREINAVTDEADRFFAERRLAA